MDRFLVLQDTDSLYFFGERILPLGDVSSDGHGDILVWRRVGSILEVNPSFVFHGGAEADNVFDLELDSLHAAVNMVGDVNDDGHNDLGYNKGWDGFRVIYGGPSSGRAGLSSVFRPATMNTAGSKTNPPLYLTIHIDIMNGSG